MRQLICFPLLPSPPLPNLLSTKLLSDSHFNGVPYAISVRADGPRPNIVLDNLLVENSASVVLVSGGETILPGKPGPTHTHTHLTHSFSPETFCLGGIHIFLYSGLTGEKKRKKTNRIHYRSHHDPILGYGKTLHFVQWHRELCNRTTRPYSFEISQPVGW